MDISLFDSPSNVNDAVANAERARAAGMKSYWVPQVMNADTMVTLGVVGSHVPDIGLGTSVMAMQTMMPQTMAQQARTVNQISGGRLTLGIGVNHKPVVEGMWGMSFNKPYSRFVEYLDALVPLLSEQRVSYAGEFVTQHTGINVPAETPSLMLAALGPKMLKLAGERSEGTITWMTGPNTIRDHIKPNLEEGGGGRVAAGVGIIVTDDPEKSKAWANEALAIYPTLPSYRAVMDREGAKDASDLVLIGTKEEVQAGIDLYEAAGTDEIAINMIGSPEQNEQAWELFS